MTEDFDHLISREEDRQRDGASTVLLRCSQTLDRRAEGPSDLLWEVPLLACGSSGEMATSTHVQEHDLGHQVRLPSEVIRPIRGERQVHAVVADAKAPRLLLFGHDEAGNRVV